MMKKWITAILCVMLLLALAVPALADGNTQFTITADKTQAMPGDTITFTVSVSGSNACTSYGLNLDYDKTAFDWISGSCTASGATLKDFSDGVLVVMTDPAAVPSGAVATFQLKVKSGAAAKQYTVTGSASANNESGAVSTGVTGAKVTVGCNHQYDNDCDDTCNLCSEKRTPPHNWDAGTVTAPAGCTSTGTKTYTCQACKTTKTEDIPATGHKYDNDCDTTCNNNCGTTREAKHSYVWQSDKDTHWQQCKVCGDRKTAEAHKPGKEPTESKGQDCTVCGRQLKAPLGHTHDYSEEWSSDVLGHWHECPGCGDMIDSENHTYDNDCDPDCNICGYKRNPQHIYDERYSSDAEGHWHQCINCGEQMEFEPHISGPEATLDTPQLCTVCGYEIAPSLAHKHDFSGQWKFDDEGHWHQCPDCGMDEEKLPHNWDEGKITRQPSASVVGRKTFTCTGCGYERIEDIPVESQEEVQKPGFPWWIIVIIVAIPVVAVSAYLIVNAGKHKEDDITDEE